MKRRGKSRRSTDDNSLNSDTPRAVLDRRSTVALNATAMMMRRYPTPQRRRHPAQPTSVEAWVLAWWGHRGVTAGSSDRYIFFAVPVRVYITRCVHHHDARRRPLLVPPACATLRPYDVRTTSAIWPLRFAHAGSWWPVGCQRGVPTTSPAACCLARTSSTPRPPLVACSFDPNCRQALRTHWAHVTCRTRLMHGLATVQTEAHYCGTTARSRIL